MIQNFDLHLQAQTSCVSISAQSCCLDRAMLELPNFSACYEKLKTGYCSTSVYEEVWLKYFDSNFSMRIILFDSGINLWSRIVNKVQWKSMINRTKWKSPLMLKFPSWLTTASRSWNTTCLLMFIMHIYGLLEAINRTTFNVKKKTITYSVKMQLLWYILSILDLV